VAQPARCAALLSIGGIVVDALIVPLLALPPPRSWLRLLGVTLGICFHLTNACLFHIGIFPWLMLMSLVLWRTEDGEGENAGARLVEMPAAEGTAAALAAVGPTDVPAARMAGASLEDDPVQDKEGVRRQSLRLRKQSALAETNRSSPLAVVRPPCPSRRPAALCDSVTASPQPSPLAFAFCALFVAWHVALPLRRFVGGPGSDATAATWSQEGYLGGWLMKLHTTDGLAVLHLEKACVAADGDASVEVIQLLPQLDPWLTRHQRRFVAVRPSAMQQYASHRARLFHGASPSGAAAGTCNVSARVISCFTHNRRWPQPLYISTVDLLQADRSCLGSTALGRWLEPLRPPAPFADGTPPPQPALNDECSQMLRRNPLTLLHAAEAGFYRLREESTAVSHGAGAGQTDSHREARPPQVPLQFEPFQFDAEAVSWFWHGLRMLQEAMPRSGT
jgi:hypothetical protein